MGKGVFPNCHPLKKNPRCALSLRLRSPLLSLRLSLDPFSPHEDSASDSPYTGSKNVHSTCRLCSLAGVVPSSPPPHPLPCCPFLHSTPFYLPLGLLPAMMVPVFPFHLPRVACVNVGPPAIMFTSLPSRLIPAYSFSPSFGRHFFYVMVLPHLVPISGRQRLFIQNSRGQFFSVLPYVPLSLIRSNHSLKVGFLLY